MPHRIATGLFHVMPDILVFVLLQSIPIPNETNIKLQIAALSGSMLAVRTLDENRNFLTWIRVAASGLVIANYLGLYFCELRNVKLETFAALFYFAVIGFFSDILVRVVKSFGDTLLASIPDLTNSLTSRIKDFIKPKNT